jgi:hypothetical protein
LICGVPATQVRTVDCNRFNYKISTAVLVANPVASAIQYEYEFRDFNTNALIASKIVSNTPAVFLNTVTGLVVGQYNVAVRANRAGTWGSFGSACPIGVSSVAKDGEADEVAFDEEGNIIANFEINGLEMMAMPNPFSGETNMLVSSATNEDIQINIFDMTGRLVKELKAVANQKFVVGSELENGVYVVNATNQSGSKTVFRLVKQ